LNDAQIIGNEIDMPNRPDEVRRASDPLDDSWFDRPARRISRSAVLQAVQRIEVRPSAQPAAPEDPDDRHEPADLDEDWFCATDAVDRMA